MSKQIKILFIEDLTTDTELIKREVSRNGIQYTQRVVETEEDFIHALKDFMPDIILSDYQLPHFNGMQALILRSELAPSVPFILVTGSTNEEIAVECMKAGSDDYIIKENLKRLGPAIIEAIKKKEIIQSKENIEESLHESQEIFNMFMEHSPVYVFFKDHEAKPIRLSKNYERMLGMPVQNIIGKSMDELFPSDLAKKMIADDLKVIKDGKIVNIIEEMNGRIYETTKFPILIKDRPCYLAGFTIDISDRINSEKAIEESVSLLKATLESTADGILVVDIHGKIVQYNQKFAEMWRIPPEIIDTHDDEIALNFILNQLINPESFVSKVKELYLATEAISFDNIEFNDGRIFERYSQPQKIGEKTVGRVWSFRDITDRKQTENELIKAKEKAEENDRLKTAFLHNISHEVRTPMNAIVGFSELIKDPDLTSEKLHHFTEIICQSSNQLLSIITDIINIATIESGQEKINEHVINLNIVLESLYNQFKSKAKKQNIEFSYESSLDDKDASIKTDETKFVQILSNLITNAIKFTNMGYVDFGYNLKGNYLEFYVKDTGIGIPAEMHEKIFERFQQADNSATREFGGTGLGLCITKAYVELLGGKIGLSSQPEKGSIFYFTIPYKKAYKSDLSEVKYTMAGKIKNVKPKTILIAEDEENNFMFIKELLSALNFNIIRAHNGMEVIEICKTNQTVDLILMDIKMPFMDGYEATQRIKESKPDLPVIALTAYAQESDREKALAYGCDDYIAKPIITQQLTEILNKYL